MCPANARQRAPRRRAPRQAISAAVSDLKPKDVASIVLPLLTSLLKDPYGDVRAAALRQVPAVGERLITGLPVQGLGWRSASG
jgi:hypothetical protein